MKGGENRPEEQVLGMKEHRELFARGDAYLATSVVTLTEVLDSQQSAESRETFQKLFQRKNFLLQQVNRRIAIIAHDIRDYYQNTNDGLPTVTTPDALQLATAIYLEGCDEFYTFDEHNRGTNTTRPSRGLISLSGTVAGKYRLTITKPRVTLPSQLNLGS